MSAAFLLSNLALLVFLTTEAEAQTTRPRGRKSIIVVQPTPLPDLTPEIISRAEDGSSGEVFVAPATPAAQTPTDEQKTNETAARAEELDERIRSLEADRPSDDRKQKRLLLNLDILTRAEQRAETLRKQMFDFAEKEASIRTKLEQLEDNARPEMIDRSVAFAGTLRPEELRDMRRKNFDAEKRNLQSLLIEVQNTRASLGTTVQRADILVEKLRLKLEKEIDDALIEEPKNQ